MTQLDWKKGMSRTYNREYWYNCKTGESVWRKPVEVLEYEKQERQKQIAMHVEDIESKKKLEEELEKKRKQVAIKARRKEYLKQLQEKKQAQKEADQKEADQNQPSDPNAEEARRKARMMERVKYLANEYMPSSISCRNTSSSPSSYSMQIANNNGGSWTIEGQSHWTREDYMDELRNINQSLRDY